MKTATALMSVLLLASGCIATAPVTVAWRSNTSQQCASTNGVTKKGEDANTVNADRSSETQAAVSTSSGAAGNSGQAGLPDAPAPAAVEGAPKEEARDAGR